MPIAYGRRDSGVTSSGSDLREAAVDADFGAQEVARVVAGEECHRGRDLFRLAHPAGGYFRADFCGVRLEFLVALAGGTVKGRLDRAGVHGVDANVLFGKLRCVLATLEGAILTASAQSDPTIFARATASPDDAALAQPK